MSHYEGGAAYYRHIAAVIFLGFGLCLGAIGVLNLRSVEPWLLELIGQRKAFTLELYFWAALGATIASYKYFAQDKEMNEVEALKPSPDPSVLRYPNVFDVVLYAQRILFSGVLGVIAALIVFAGLGYFDASLDNWGLKQKAFFIVLCFVVGIYQNDFLAFLFELNKRFFQKRPERAED